MNRQAGHRAQPAFFGTLAVLLLLAGCGRSSAPGTTDSSPASAPASANGALTDSDKVLNVYNWSDYIDPSVVPAFEKEYGIKVNYDVFDSNEVVETKLLAGHTGYDIVVPSGSFLARQITAGVFQKLDKSQLSNLGNLDAGVNQQVASYDPTHDYGVTYLWGTSGVGYNEGKIAAAMPNAPVDSFAMFYDPNVVKNFQKCGVSILDAPDEVAATVLLYLGRDPNSESLDDLKAVEKVLLSIRPFIRYVNSSKYIDDLANGEICLALGWSGDVGQARLRATQAGKSDKISYHVPKEGAISFFDMLAIPADAAHPKNAHLFINYLLRPDVAAKDANFVRYTSPNQAAASSIDQTLYNDQNLFPRGDQLSKLHPNPVRSPTYTRELNRTWTRFKTGT